MWVNEERVLKTFLALVGIASPTYVEREIVNILTREFRDMGYEPVEDGAASKIGGNAGNLIVTLDGTASGPTLILAAHLDTVEPCHGVVPRVESGIVRSSGHTILGADDKAGVTALVELARVLSEREPATLPRSTIHIVLTVAEEKGLRGAKNLELELLAPDFAYVLDADGSLGNVVTKAPYQDTSEVRFIGKSAHAGVAPESGINSISAAAKAISLMKLGRLDEETTANVGAINGGTATNIVPELTVVKAEARSHSVEKLEAQTAHMAECWREGAAQVGATIEIKSHREYDGFDISPDEPVVRLLFKAMDMSGLRLTTASSGGGSDTNVFNARGVPAVALGMGARHPHTEREEVEVRALSGLAELVVNLVTCASGAGRD